MAKMGERSLKSYLEECSYTLDDLVIHPSDILAELATRYREEGNYEKAKEFAVKSLDVSIEERNNSPAEEFSLAYKHGIIRKVGREIRKFYTSQNYSLISNNRFRGKAIEARIYLFKKGKRKMRMISLESERTDKSLLSIKVNHKP